MKMTITLLATLLGATTALSEDKITYDDHVQPLLRANCFKCHNQDKAKADLDLSTYPALMQGGSSGPSVVAGDPDASYLYTTMAHIEEPFMPEKSPKRPSAELDTIKQWILGGLLENSSSVAIKPKKPTVDLSLASAPTGKPEGPPPMPADLLLEPPLTTKRANAVTALAASPWAPLVAIAGHQQIVLYNTENFRPEGILPYPEGEAMRLMFSRNAALLLAAGGKPGSSGRVVMWNVKDGSRVLEIGDDYDVIMAADISGDQSYIATGGTDKYIKIYTTKDRTKVHNIKKHTEWVSALQFSPDAVLIATGDRNGNLYVWEAETMQQFYELRGHKGKITGISWRLDSNVLASSSEDGTVKLWNMHDGKLIKSFTAHSGGALSISYSVDGKLVTSGRDKLVRIWDGNGTKIKELKGFGDLPLSAVFAHDNNKVITGDWTGAAIVWDSENQKELQRLAPNPPSISQRIAFLEKLTADQKAKHAQTTAEAKKQVDALNAINGELAKHQKALTDLTNQQKMATAELAEAQKVMASLQKPVDLAPHQQKVTAATAARKQAEDAWNKAKPEIPQKQAALDAKKKPVIDTNAVAAAEKALSEAPDDDEKAKRQTHLDTVKKGVVNQEAIKQAQTAFDQSRKKVADLEATFKKADAALNTAKQELANVQKQNADKQAMMAAAQKRVDDINQRLASINGQLTPAQKLVTDTTQKKADQATKADAAQKAVDAAKPHASLPGQIAFWKAAAFNVNVHKAKEAVTAKQQEKFAYEQAALEAAAKAKQAEADVANQQGELEKLKAEYQRLKAAAGS